jgi:hypothetical protein
MIRVYYVVLALLQHPISDILSQKTEEHGVDPMLYHYPLSFPI